MQIEFILRTSLFLLTLLPLSLFIPLYLESVNKIFNRIGFWKTAMGNSFIKIMILGFGLVAISILTYYWWGIVCYQLILGPLFGTAMPGYAFMLLVPSFFIFIPLFLSFYSSMEDNAGRQMQIDRIRS